MPQQNMSDASDQEVVGAVSLPITSAELQLVPCDSQQPVSPFFLEEVWLGLAELATAMKPSTRWNILIAPAIFTLTVFVH